MSTKSVDGSLFGRIRLQLLCLFFLNPHRSYFLLELVDILCTGRGGVQRELANLVESEIITREKSGMKVLFRQSENCPVAEEIRNLLVKLVDVKSLVSMAVNDSGVSIRTAVISSIEKRKFSEPLKLLVSCDENCEAFLEEIKRIELLCGTEIEFTAVRSYELKEYARKPGGQWIADKKYIMLAGTAADLEPEDKIEEETVSEPDLFAGTDFGW